MNKQTKISFLWLVIAIGYIFHSTYHLSGAIFGADIRLPDSTGEVPVIMYVFRIVLEIFTLTLVLLTLYFSGKTFRWFSFIWACILGILNLVHLVETIIGEPSELSQLTLLAFIFAANIVLILETRNQTKLGAGS